MFYAPEYGIYGVAFHEPGGDHGASGVGPPYLYYDGRTGALIGERQPWAGTAADIFLQAQFPLHSGAAFGAAGRLLVVVTAAALVTMSFTSLYLWWSARVARRRAGTTRLSEL